jgi:hypothetical protein
MKKILTLLLGIIVLTGCTKEDDVVVNSQNKGKTSILITGNITNEQAAAQITAEFGPYTENVYIQNTTGLTTVDLSAFSSLVNLIITKNSNLATINLNGLTAIYDSFAIANNNALSALSFPSLTSTPPLNNEFDIQNNPVLTSIYFPVLVNSSGEFGIRNNDSLSSLLLPVLKTVIYFSVSNNSKLTSIGIASLSSCSEELSFYGNAFPSSQINIILNKLLTVTPATGKYINLSGQVPPAPPTGQGIINKQTLINAGNSVSTD